MAKKEFRFRGKKLEELQTLTIKELAELLPARSRRSLLRGIDDEHKNILEAVKNGQEVKTHCRDMIILPEMVNKMLRVHNGKSFEPVNIQPEMIGHRLGEFVQTRKRIAHSAPGVGATKSSANISVK